MASVPDEMPDDETSDPVTLPTDGDGDGTIDNPPPPTTQPDPPAKPRVKAGEIIGRKVATLKRRSETQAVAEKANADFADAVKADDAVDPLIAGVVKQAVDGVLIRDEAGSIAGLYIAANNAKGYNITHPVDADFEVDDPEAMAP